MRLALKFTAALIVGIAVVMVVNTLVRVRREVELFELDQKQDQRIMGKTLRDAIQTVWLTEDEAHARAVVAATNTDDFRVRWRWLDDLQDGGGATKADGEAEHLAATLATGQEATLVRHDRDGDRRYTYVPMTPAGSRPAALELSERASPPRSFIRASVVENVLSTVSIVSVCSLIAMTLGFWLVGRPMRL